MYSNQPLPDYENMGPPSKPCFCAQILRIRKVSIIGYRFTKLGIGSEDLQDLMVTRLDQ
jgi:hypothetical protein